MKALTIFRAFVQCEDWKRYYLEQRHGNSWGIAVNDDYPALRWQHYDRLLRKLDKRLTAILTAYDNADSVHPL